MTRAPAPLAPAALITLLSIALSAPARAEPIGRDLAQRCMLCHGERGQNQGLGIPRIGGREYYGLLAEMSRFRNGERIHPVMSVIMQTLDEVDMAEVAEFFAAAAAEARPRR